MTNETKISVRYSTVDGHSEVRDFSAIEPARDFAHHWIGRFPEMGQRYAISDDGIGKIQVVGATLAYLFPGARDEHHLHALYLRGE